MFERIHHMMIKEFIQIFRDVRMRMILFVVPIIQTLIFGYAVTTDVHDITTAIYDRDNTIPSRDLIASFARSGYFTIVDYLKNDQDINSVLDKGQAMLVLNIDDQFAADLRAGKTASLQAIVDGTDANTASIVFNYAQRIVNQFAQEQRTTPIAVTSDSRAWFNENLESRNYFVPGIIATILTLVTLTLTSMAIVREKEIGTMEQMIVTPITRWEFILGKTAPFVLIAYVDLVAIVLVGVYWFEIPLRGSLLLLFCSVSLYLVTTLGVGFFISTISHTQQQALMSTFMFYFPAILLSGFIFPIANMPEVVQWLTYINPLRYFLVIIRGIFLKGVGWNVLWPQIAALVVMGIFIQWQAIRRFQKSIQ